MSKDYSVNLEEELQEALQDAVDGYLDGKEAINEDKFGEFIKGKLGEFALEYAADNSEDILNAIFGEDTVKKSKIPASKIASAYELGDKINEGIETAIDIHELYCAAQDLKNARGDVNLRNEALGRMTDSALSLTKTAVEQIPIAGPVYSLIVGELQNVFESGFDLVTKHVAQIQYTELMCDYYSGKIDLNELRKKINKIYNLDKKSKDQIDALLLMESELSQKGVSEEDTSYFKTELEKWSKKGSEIYDKMSQEERDEYGKEWPYDTTEGAKDDASKNNGDATKAPAPKDPLIIDLGKKGIELTSLDDGVHFDLDKNGFAEKTAWIGSEDGFLALDRNGNGKIDNGGELFGDQVTLKDGSTSSEGFEALAELDENGDGVIDKNDSEFANLRVWIDANHNGV